jgi:TolB-like protein/Flp pilus assembly protein TadD
MRPGTKLGPYEIIEILGQGGMGEVYRARDSRLQRQVAIKTVAARAVGDPEFRARFDREARAVAALSHPNILAIHDVGEHDGIPYVAVELLEGATLRSAIDASSLPLVTTIDYASQIGNGLAAAHDRGIVHRDLKPENVFVTRDGRVKLLDFGLATEPDVLPGSEVTRLNATERGAVLGTAGYMSPEQVRGDRTDTRSDIFAFGCVLYEMLAGRQAFAGDNRIETLHAVLKSHPPDLTTLRPDVPPTLDRLVRRCLEKEPERRFQSARDLVFALETLSHASDVPRTIAAPGTRGERVRRIAAITGVAAVLGVAAAIAWSTSRPRAAEPKTAAAAADDRRRVLAILPFENISRDRDAYFAAGMTEEITGRLSQLSALRVVGRTAVAQFKDPRSQLPAMAKELGIGSVVTGSVREDGGRVRVNVDLLDAQSGQVLWSDQYDRAGVDVFAAQSDIALRVSEALRASVTLDERARIGKRPTVSVAAYELFMRARTAPGKTLEEHRKAANELLSQAVAIDPRFAEAYAAIATNFYFLGAYGDLTALPRGLDAAHKAIEIDPQLGAAREALALNLQQMGRLQEALAEYRRAVAIDPSNTDVLSDASFGESTSGRYDEALTHASRALALVPNTPVPYYHVGVPLVLLDDDARSERFLTAAATRFVSTTRPDRIGRLEILLAFLDLRRGRAAAAVERMQAAALKTPDDIEVLLTRAEIATFAGSPDAPRYVRELMGRAGEGMFHNAPYPVKLAHAYYLQRTGATVEASKIFDEVLAANRRDVTAGADWPMAFMQNAAVHALRGETSAALAELDRAYAAGWRDGRTMAIDPLLASLRSEARFTQVLSRIQADVAAMRARADYSALP